MLFLSVVAAGCSDSHSAGGDAGRDGSPPWELDAGRLFPQPGSWTVVGTLHATAGSFPSGSSELEHAFTIVVNGSGGSARIRAGAYGDETEFVVDAPDDHQLVTAESVDIAIADDEACGGPGPVTYEGLTLRFDDRDGDHRDDELTGTATGTVRWFGGDVIWDAPFTATFVGVRDTVGPAIEIVGALDDRSPVDGVFARIDEPVASGLGVALVAPDGTEIPLDRLEDRESSFATRYGTVLAFGARYEVRVGPVFADLANNPGTGLPLAITTAADPGVQPEDGFEGGALALTSGPVALVDAADGARVISGSSSLVLPPSELPGSGSARATLRLAVAPGDTTLRFRYALLAIDASGGILLGNTRVLADGSDPMVPSLETTADAWTPTSIANAPFAGPTREVSVALPATALARGEVVLDVQVGAGGCGGPLPQLLGLMIDDVVIE